jgi:hypothetical protein
MQTLYKDNEYMHLNLGTSLQRLESYMGEMTL